MKTEGLVKPLVVALLTLGASAAAHGADEDFGVTLRVVESSTDLPDAVTKVIALPEHVAPAALEHRQADEHAQKGLDTANEARNLGREFGKDIAEQAKAKRPKN